MAFYFDEKNGEGTQGRRRATSMRKLQVQPYPLPLWKSECVALVGDVHLGCPYTSIFGGRQMSILNAQQHVDRSAHISIV
jgi:hypothetical protein